MTRRISLLSIRRWLEDWKRLPRQEEVFLSKAAIECAREKQVPLIAVLRRLGFCWCEESTAKVPTFVQDFMFESLERGPTARHRGCAMKILFIHKALSPSERNVIQAALKSRNADEYEIALEVCRRRLASSETPKIEQKRIASMFTKAANEQNYWRGTILGRELSASLREAVCLV